MRTERRQGPNTYQHLILPGTDLYRRHRESTPRRWSRRLNVLYFVLYGKKKAAPLVMARNDSGRQRSAALLLYRIQTSQAKGCRSFAVIGKVQDFSRGISLGACGQHDDTLENNEKLASHFRKQDNTRHRRGKTTPYNEDLLQDE